MIPSIIMEIWRILKRIKRTLSGVALVLLSTFAIGVVGFHYIEKLSWMDSVYFTFVTLSTIGFGDITPATLYGKILVIFVATLGIASFATVITSIVQSMVSERMNRVLGLLNPYAKGHVVVCGWNETVKAAIKELLALTDKQIVIVDDKLDRVPIDDPRVEFVKGDYKDLSVLKRAGVDKASDVLVATGNDSETVLTVLQVRALNKNVHIAAEARGNISEVLKQAGANHVINSLTFGGRLLAISVVEPGTAFIFDDLSSTGAGNDVYEVKVPKEFVGRKFEDLVKEFKEKTNVLPLAIRRGNEVLINPSLGEEVTEKDYIVVVATPEEFKKLKATWKIKE